MIERPVPAYWARPAAAVCALLSSSPDGLEATEAARRLALRRHVPRRFVWFQIALPILARQFGNPLVLILVFAAGVAALVGDWLDAGIVVAIVLGSGVLGAWHEARASTAVARLRERMRSRSTVLRARRRVVVPNEEVVPGDVIELAAGALVPGDGIVLESRDCFVTQAALTGESLPVEKQPGVAAENAALAQRTNCVFMGTSVRSGTAKMLVVAVGDDTVYGEIGARLRLRPPETEFERGVRSYGYLLTRVMIILVLIVFVANVFLERPPIDALLFAMALAVGISPELLPAVIGVMLSRGAADMAAHGVIVRELNAIENFGSMDVLCTDKTGTLTEGSLVLESAVDASGAVSHDVLLAAAVNARFETGLANPLDEAILARVEHDALDLTGWRKVDEVPYDFERKRLTVVAEQSGSIRRRMLYSKGAVANMLDVCDRVCEAGIEVPLDAERRVRLEAAFAAASADGSRVLAVATKTVEDRGRYDRSDEQALVFAGFLLFSDPPKAGVRATLDELERLGIGLKIITGDNRFVAAHVAVAVNLPDSPIVTGTEVDRLGNEALRNVALRTAVFAEVDPQQKERIVTALKRGGHVVGFLGDGINDVPALHAADVGISVDGAVDVAKEAADLVLLEHDLAVLCRGVTQGRATFANTLKYVTITTSANFGNMLSMAAASFVLPFLPLLAKQILLNNLLSDIPGMMIAGDAVDPELTAEPRRWDSMAIRRAMLGFGAVSSLFDVLSFALLLLVFATPAELFRTGWFVESLLTELAIVFVLRTRRAWYSSRAARGLWLSSVAVAVLAVALPYLPFAEVFGFVPVPLPIMATLVGVTTAYVVCSELVKLRWFARPARATARPAR